MSTAAGLCAIARRVPVRNRSDIARGRGERAERGLPRATQRGNRNSAAGARSGGGIPGLAGPGAAGSTFRQLWKECKHGNEEKSEESCEEEDRQEGQEEEGWKTPSSGQEEASEEEAGFAQEARKEKGGPQGRQEKSCEETRQEEGETRSGGQAGGETRSAGTDGSTCCAVGRGGARGKNCPESRCCLAVSDRVTALGGSRIVCGRALCRQSPNRRHSALELPVPRLSHTGRRHFTSRISAASGAVSPKIFLLCVAPERSRQVSDSTLLFSRLTERNPLIRLRFSRISQRLHQPLTEPPKRTQHRDAKRWCHVRVRRQRRSRSPLRATRGAGFHQQRDNKLSRLPGEAASDCVCARVRSRATL